MKQKTGRLVSAVSGLGLLVGSLVGGASAASATSQSEAGTQSCYDYAQSYFKPLGSWTYPTGYLTTTGNCGDISIKPNTNRYVRVCFVASGCQDSYTLATAGSWNVIAFYVSDGSKFWFDFRSDAQSSGSWAA